MFLLNENDLLHLLQLMITMVGELTPAKSDTAKSLRKNVFV